MMATLSAAVLLTSALAAAKPSPAPPAAEVRALWVVRTSITSPRAIDEVVENARRSGINTLIVQVRGRGDAYFGGGLEPRSTALAAEAESFDPLAYLLTRTRPAGIQVHAWLNTHLLA